MTIHHCCRGRDIQFVSLGEYIAANPYTPTYSDNKIEVIYAEGQIVQGNSEKGTLGSTTLADQLAEARMDEEVKAVVLRVNSPGGSALASEDRRRLKKLRFS